MRKLNAPGDSVQDVFSTCIESYRDAALKNRLRSIAATAIELATSYLLEALTGAWPWQTYRDYAINFEGRIALSPSIRFGLGGLLFLYVLQPLFHRLVHSLSPRVRRGACIAVLVLLAVDCAVLLFR